MSIFAKKIHNFHSWGGCRPPRPPPPPHPSLYAYGFSFKCNWSIKHSRQSDHITKLLKFCPRYFPMWHILNTLFDCVKILLNSCSRFLMHTLLIFMSGLTSVKNISHMGTKSSSSYQLKVESMLLKKIIYMFGPEIHLCSLQYQTRYLLLRKCSKMLPQGWRIICLNSIWVRAGLP